MTKSLLKASLWGILIVSLFYSCRTDSVATEQIAQAKEKIAAFETFEKKNNIIKPIASNDQSISSTKYVSYSYPFALIIYNFLQTHSDYAKQVEREAGTIRLDVVSQTFGDAKKAVIFPVTNNEGKVIAAWAGVVNENRDYVDFYYLNGNSDNVTTIKTAFQNYYDQKKKKQLASLATASIKGINPIALAPTPPPVVPVVDINEVHITVPPPDLTISSSAAFGAGSVNYGNTLGGGMSGGSTTHGGGGGSGGSDTPPAGMVMPPPPKNPINDIKKYLSCFDQTKSANLTVYAQNMLASPPGHAFITLQQGNNIMTFGFYPKDPYLNTLSGRGVMGEDGLHPYNQALNVGTISPAQLQNIISRAIDFASTRYDLAVRNCADFAREALNIANVPGANWDSNWSRPTDIANIINAQKSGVTGEGDAPVTRRTCE